MTTHSGDGTRLARTTEKVSLWSAAKKFFTRSRNHFGAEDASPRARQKRKARGIKISMHRPINPAFDSPWPRVFSVKTRAVEPRTRPVNELVTHAIGANRSNQSREARARGIFPAPALRFLATPPLFEFVGSRPPPPGRVADSSAPAGCAGARRGTHAGRSPRAVAVAHSTARASPNPPPRVAAHLTSQRSRRRIARPSNGDGRTARDERLGHRGERKRDGA